MKRSVCIIGPYPPPYGGISVHIKRLIHKLKERSIDYVIFDTTKIKKNLERLVNASRIRKVILKILFSPFTGVIHYHGHSWEIRFLLGLFKRKKTIIFTIHGTYLKNSIQKSNKVKKFFIITGLKLASYVIATHVEIYQYLISLGLKKERVLLIPSFIPPLLRDEDFKKIPDFILEFISSHTPVISANASRISFHNGKDLYGIDMSIKLCYLLRERYKNIGFIFVISNINDKNYFMEMKRKVEELNLKENFIFFISKSEYYPLLAKVDLFLRPTTTDAEAISINEALTLGIPVIASDSVKRVDGVITFRNRNVKDLFEKVVDVIENYEYYKKNLSHYTVKDYGEEIINLYIKGLKNAENH